jgi:AcrR family transcriptional regulator
MARTEDPAGRERILSAATDLFYVNGVRAVGMAEVIAAAGCGKHMLYRHFPSKAALTAAYLRRVRAERDKSTTRALAAAAGASRTTSAGDAARGIDTTRAGEQLVALVAEVAAWVQRRDYRGCAFRNYLTEFPAGDDEPAAVARDYLRDTRRQVDELVATLGKPGVTGDRIWLLIDALYGGTGTPPRVAVDWAWELVT